MAKNANHFLAATLTPSKSKPNVEKYFWKAANSNLLSQSYFTMSSALGMNLMPPTSAFQHGLQQAAVQAAAAAAAAASKQPLQQTASLSETNEDLEHEPTMTDSMTGNNSEHAAGKLALASSGEYSLSLSRS